MIATPNKTLCLRPSRGVACLFIGQTGVKGATFLKSTRGEFGKACSISMSGGDDPFDLIIQPFSEK